MNHHVVTDYTNVNLENVHLKVYVRLRPPGDGSNAVDPRFLERFAGEPKKLTLHDPGHHYGEYAFMFDQVFWTDAQQEELFNSVCKPQVDHILNGFNSCCFAYGQTGSGKTHTMFGNAGDKRGLIPRAMEYLCRKVEERKASGGGDTAMVVSFLEIYCDQIRDLGKVYLNQQQGSATSPRPNPYTSPRHPNPQMAASQFTSPRHTMAGHSNNASTPNGSSMAVTRKTSDLFARIQMARHESFARSRSEPGGGSMDVSGTSFRDDYQAMNLEIREDGEGNVFVKDLTLIPVNTEQEVMAVISEGLKLRATHETKLNAVSSRSHTIVSVTVVQRQENGEAITGTLHMVDLAGSERLKKSDSQGVRLREAVHINSSLTALGKVVVALDPAAERTHVPYRDAKLTRILQNSIGGNAYTAVVATIHPLMDYSEECLSSLQFANRCRSVQNQPRINYVGVTEADKDKRIKRLTEEVGALNRKLRAMDGKSNERLLTVLQSLGHRAVLGADGSIETADGKRIGLVGGELVIQAVQGGSAAMSGMWEQGEGEGGRGSIVVARLNALVDELKSELSEYKKKSSERKKRVSLLEEELKKEKHHVTKLGADLRDKLKDTQDKLDKKSRQLRDYATCLNAQHRETLQRLVDDNQAIIREHMTQAPGTPDNRRVHNALLTKARLAEEFARKEEQQKLHAQLVNLTRGKESQMENLRQQYEAHLRHKDEQLQAFVDEFNRYRTKKRQEGSGLSNELLQLYDYASSLKRVLDRAEAGLYPLREVGPSRHVMEVPRADKPQHQLLVDPAALPVTRRMLSKRQHETLTLQKVHHRATQALCSTAKLNEVSAEQDMQSILRCYSQTLTREDIQRRTEEAMRESKAAAEQSMAPSNGHKAHSDGAPPLTHPPPQRPSLTASKPVPVPVPKGGSDSESSEDEGSHAQRARSYAADQPWASTKPRPQSAHPIVMQPPPDKATGERPHETSTIPARDTSRLRPQSAPPQKPSHDTAQLRRSSTFKGNRDSQEPGVVEEPGVWGGDDKSLEHSSTAHRPHDTQALTANGRAIFSDYDDGEDEDLPPPMTDSQPLIQPPASLVEAAAAAMGGAMGGGGHYLPPPSLVPLSQSMPNPQPQEGLGWGQQQTYSAGQQLWSISMRELKHRRESADSFGQVSVSGSSDKEAHRADSSVAGQGQVASIYRDYDDNNNDDSVDPSAILMAGTGEDQDEGFQDKIDLQGPGIGPYGTHTHPRSTYPAGGSLDSLPAQYATLNNRHSQTGPQQVQAPSDVPPRRASSSHHHAHSHAHGKHGGAADEEVRRYRAQVREQSRRLLELRCSYEALQRQMTKQADQRPPLPMPTPHKHKQQQPPRSRSAGSRRHGQGEGAASASDIRASHKVLLNKRPVSASVRAL